MQLLKELASILHLRASSYEKYEIRPQLKHIPTGSIQ